MPFHSSFLFFLLNKDGVRQLDDPSIQSIVAPSAGCHIILPNYYAPAHMGLVDPSTSDGRVIFFLPWQGNTIAGTTGKVFKKTIKKGFLNKEFI